MKGEWDWIPEKEALQLLGMASKRALREKVKSRVWKIHFTTTTEKGWFFQYSKKDIYNHLEERSNKLKTVSAQ